MTKQLTGPALVAYLRDNPTSEAMQAAADEIERLREALEMIAGIRPCPNALMGNADIARAALSGGTNG